MEKSLKDISWDVTEEVYRQDPALSYSILSKFKRSGFNELDHLFDKVESPSLTFGSAVDSIITGGEEEFNSRFIVADFPSIPDNIISIVKYLYETNKDECNLENIPDKIVIQAAASFNYQNNWKPETRAKVIKEKGSKYYELLHIAENKTILNSPAYQDVCNTVNALKNSAATREYFADDVPWSNIEHCYQLKFKDTIDGVDYRCMADLIIVDHDNKVIYPIDLKTSSKAEWDFYKSFIDWNYHIQARLYAKIILHNIRKDEYFKSFSIAPYRFIVANKNTLTPLVWTYKDTFKQGTLFYGKDGQIICEDPCELGILLSYYLKNKPKVPDGITIEGTNDLNIWLNKI